MPKFKRTTLYVLFLVLLSGCTWRHDYRQRVQPEHHRFELFHPPVIGMKHPPSTLEV